MATQSWVENACCLVKIQALDKASPCHQHVRFDGYQEKSQGDGCFSAYSLVTTASPSFSKGLDRWRLSGCAFHAMSLGLGSVKFFTSKRSMAEPSWRVRLGT